MPNLFVRHIVYWRTFHLRRSPSLFPKKVLLGCNFIAIKSIQRKVFGSKAGCVLTIVRSGVILLARHAMRASDVSMAAPGRLITWAFPKGSPSLKLAFVFVFFVQSQIAFWALKRMRACPFIV